MGLATKAISAVQKMMKKTQTHGRPMWQLHKMPHSRNPNSFIFMQFWGKFFKLVCSVPPPRGNPVSATAASIDELADFNQSAKISLLRDSYLPVLEFEFRNCF